MFKKEIVTKKLGTINNKMTLDNLKKYTVGQLIFFPLLFVLLLIPVNFGKSWSLICYSLLKSKGIFQLSNYLSSGDIDKIQNIIGMIYTGCFVIYCSIALIFLTNITISESTKKKFIIISIFTYVIFALGNNTLFPCVVYFINMVGLSTERGLYIINFIIITIVLFALRWALYLNKASGKGNKVSNKIKNKALIVLLKVLGIILGIVVFWYEPYNQGFNWVFLGIVLACILFAFIFNFDFFSTNIIVIMLIFQNSFSISAPMDFTLAMIFAFILTEISVHQLYQLKEKQQKDIYEKIKEYIKKMLIGGGIGGSIIIIILYLFQFMIGLV